MIGICQGEHPVRCQQWLCCEQSEFCCVVQLQDNLPWENGHLQKDDMHQLGAEIDPLQTPTAQPAVPPTTSSPHCLVLRWHLAHRAHLRGQHGDAHGQLLQGKWCAPGKGWRVSIQNSLLPQKGRHCYQQLVPQIIYPNQKQALVATHVHLMFKYMDSAFFQRFVMLCPAISCLLDQRKKGRLPIPLGRVDVIHHLLCQGLPIGIFELQHLPTWRTEGILESAKIVNLLIICKG